MSKKNVPLLMSAAGVIGGFFEKLVAKAKALGILDQLHELMVGDRSEEFIGQVVDLAMKIVNKASMSFPVFKTVTLGAYDSIKAYRKALKEAGFRIGDWASDILDKIQVSRERVQLDLVKVTVKDLGFTESASLKQIYAKAKELDLEMCPAEVGPALRLAYVDQSYGEWIYIAMEPITVSDGHLRLFEVSHDDDAPWLFSAYGGPDDIWLLGSSFVFVRFRK